MKDAVQQIAGNDALLRGIFRAGCTVFLLAGASWLLGARLSSSVRRVLSYTHVFDHDWLNMPEYDDVCGKGNDMTKQYKRIHVVIFGALAINIVLALISAG
ncbi:MAG: hypothetical protein M3R24_22695, partial [Chloroflexota bacterium]|nr:hypothetical protein [Chloroflexota bacterium]